MGVSILKSGLTVEGSVLGQPVRLGLPQLPAGWEVRLRCVCGGGSLYIGENSREFVWTPPLALAEQSPDDSWVAVEFLLELRQGGGEWERRRFPAAFQIPRELGPGLRLTVEDPTGCADRYGGYVQGQSRARVRANPSSCLGARIQRTWLACGCLSGTGPTLEFDLPEAGDCRVRAQTRDSRGRRAEAEGTIAVLPWFPPEGEIGDVARCDGDGAEDAAGQWLRVCYSCRGAALNGGNALRCVVSCRAAEETTWTDYPAAEGCGTLEGSCLIPAPAAGYALRLTVTDDFASAVIPYRPAGALLDLCPENQTIGIGCRGDRTGTVSVGLDLRMEGTRLSGLPEPEEDTEPVTLGFAEGRYWRPRLLWENPAPEQGFSALTAAVAAEGFVLVEAAPAAGEPERIYALAAAGVPGQLCCMGTAGPVYRGFSWSGEALTFRAASGADTQAVPTRIFAL